MTGLIHPCQKRALIPLKFEVLFNYDTFFKVAQSYPHGPKLAQLTVSDLVFFGVICAADKYHRSFEVRRSSSEKTMWIIPDLLTTVHATLREFNTTLNSSINVELHGTSISSDQKGDETGLVLLETGTNGWRAVCQRV